MEIGNDAKEEINCLLPLFSEADSDMTLLINSRLFKFMMTYVIMRNADTYYEEAYLALLSSTIVFIYKNEKKSEWRDVLLKLLYSTLHLTFG